MDSKAILDYAVFHLTPTRTRCDLVLFRGKLSEKLASGLVEPFVSHLQYAKDQIPKGGYSITLRPPSSDDDDDASWFTKATFQRFVRFVSTPEILERIMRLEREILQIESSLQSNEILCIEEAGHQGEGNSPVSDGITKKTTNSSKSNTEEEDGSALRESSKVQLQRLMDTRKALLLKEQAMAYARAVVAGYEIDTIDDLISFADAFGASRLRTACTDFKDLYKKKHSDDQWMDELAAVQAYPVPDLSYMGTSGIMLAGENFHNNLVRTGSSEPLSDSATSDGSKENNTMSEQNSNGQQQMPWMNQIPPYMYGYQMPPYQGYPMPYFPGHMGFPPPKDHKKHKSSKKKDKDSGESESDEEDEQITSSDSSSSDNGSAAEKEYDRKHSSKGKRQNKKKKKSSKTVVIRNINYITSQKRSGDEDEISDDESSGDVSLDEASIREGVDNALASLERHNGNNRRVRKNGGKHAENGGNGYVEQGFNDNESNVNGGKASDPWGAFQNLLLSHDDSASNPKNLNVESFDEHLVMKNSNGTVSNGSKSDFHLESQKIKKPLTADDSALVIQRNGVNGFRDDTLDFANGESTHPMMKLKIASDGENALFSQQAAESRSDGLDFSSESARKIPRGEDWYVANNSSGNSQTLNHKQLDFTYDGDFVKKETSKETSVADDSFIIESTRPAFDDHYASQWKTDITTMFDKTSKTESESPINSGTGLSRSMEPDELTMVLVRESHESTASWAPEMDYAAEISFTEVDKKPTTVKENDAAVEENGKNSGGKKITKTPVKDMRSKSLSRSRLDSLSKSKTTPASRSTMQKSKLQREEEERKRLEELVIQRQKRIAERTASNNGLSPGAVKKLPSKTTPPKLGKSSSMVNGTKV